MNCPIGTSWQLNTWPDTAWACDTWGDTTPRIEQSPRASRYRSALRTRTEYLVPVLIGLLVWGMA